MEPRKENGELHLFQGRDQRLLQDTEKQNQHKQQMGWIQERHHCRNPKLRCNKYPSFRSEGEDATSEAMLAPAPFLLSGIHSPNVGISFDRERDPSWNGLILPWNRGIYSSASGRLSESLQFWYGWQILLGCPVTLRPLVWGLKEGRHARFHTGIHTKEIHMLTVSGK